MFTATKESEGGFEKIVLKNSITGNKAEIIPSCGAILHAFTVLHNNVPVNVIDSYDSENDFKINAEAKGFKSNKLSPFACRLKNAAYTFNNTAYTVQKFFLGSNAIHGLLYNEAFTVMELWADENSAGVSLIYEYKAADAGYPFNYNCKISYQLKPGNIINLNTIVTNKSNTVVPMQDGWHPYFTFGGSINELELMFAADTLVEFDNTLVPTGNFSPYNTFNQFKKLEDTFFDNCFALKKQYTQPVCMLKDASKKMQLEIYTDESYPYLQIYTPPHRNSIAVENLSAIPDAFNNGTGLIILQPESSAQFNTAYKISLLP
jgi:aldose 1-epimerase